ncbi:hypothetical protein TNCV_3105521 [Trichonephila clavipes]|nr:hypothetical protein TNCV_3105521 [Trichonephila clavipes]
MSDIRPVVLCPIDRDSTVLPVCNGVTPTDLAYGGTAYRPENIRHACVVSWCGPASNVNGNSFSPRCGCEWDYDGKLDEVLLPHVRLSVVLIGDKFVFMDDNATCHRTLPVSSTTQRGYSMTSHMASAFSRSKPHCKCVILWGGKFFETFRQTRTPIRHSQRNGKMPQQLLDNVRAKY